MAKLKDLRTSLQDGAGTAVPLGWLVVCKEITWKTHMCWAPAIFTHPFLDQTAEDSYGFISVSASLAGLHQGKLFLCNMVIMFILGKIKAKDRENVDFPETP